MGKILILFVGIVAASLTGCATHDYVRSQVDPLGERLGKLEAKVSQLGGMTEANQAAIAQANDKAQQALDVANKAAGDVKKADADAEKAVSAAARSEKAANDAEQAANEARQMVKKSEKIFKLGQQK